MNLALFTYLLVMTQAISRLNPDTTIIEGTAKAISCVRIFLVTGSSHKTNNMKTERRPKFLDIPPQTPRPTPLQPPNRPGPQSNTPRRAEKLQGCGRRELGNALRSKVLRGSTAAGVYGLCARLQSVE